MKLKTLFIAQGALWAILGLMGIVAGESVIAGWEIEVTPDLLTLNREFAMSTLAMGVIVWRIPTWVGSKLREPAFIGHVINSAFAVNVSCDIYAGAISGSGATVNLVLTIIFAILFFAMGARQKNS
jgi:hypothetical protein